MNMSRYILWRIVAISAAILLAALLLALWRARFDVQREGRGAADEVRLFETLYAIENGPAAEIEAKLAELRRINASRSLRHVRFSLSDGDGNLLVAPGAEEAPDVLQRAFATLVPGRTANAPEAEPWLLQRDDGRRFSATLSLNPASEQQEALDNLIGMLLVLLGFAAAIVLAVFATLRRALAPMQPILAAIDRFRANDLDHRLPPLPFSETDAIGRALNHMAGTLATAQEQRRALSLKLVSSQEDERTRLSRELHDEFGQRLTALRADIAWLSRRIEGQAPLREVVAGMDEQSAHLQRDIRDLLSRLRPGDARTAGFGASLHAMLDALVRSWNERLGERTRFALRFAAGGSAVDDDVALAIYRLTQEALTNSVRHAQAARVDVAIERDGDGALQWSVADDGVGIADLAGSTQRGNGLAGMRERVWAFGGDLEIGAAAAAPRAGLRLAAAFPARA